MATADRPVGPLDVFGRVLVEMGEGSARIEALGDRIVVELPSVRAAFSALRRWSGGRSRRQSIRRIHDALTTSALTVEVVVGGSTVALLGRKARAGLVSRWLGLGPLQVRMGGVLGSLGRRPGRPE